MSSRCFQFIQWKIPVSQYPRPCCMRRNIQQERRLFILLPVKATEVRNGSFTTLTCPLRPYSNRKTNKSGALAADLHPDADFLEVLPMALLLHAAVLALAVLRRGGWRGREHDRAEYSAANNPIWSAHCFLPYASVFQRQADSGMPIEALRSPPCKHPSFHSPCSVWVPAAVRLPVPLGLPSRNSPS